MELLTTANFKTPKGEKKGWYTGILYLAPGKIAGGPNLCPNSDAGCKQSCLFTAGRGRMGKIKKARTRKTRALIRDKQKFTDTLSKDIKSLAKTAKRKKMHVAVRLNGTSDLPWHTLPGKYPTVMFYGYTRVPQRMRAKRAKNNYLVFSRGTNNDRVCKNMLKEGYNVAVVFDKVPVGKKFWGYRVIDGDENDLRFLDPKPCIVGLSAKGKAKQDKTGFVIRDYKEKLHD